MSFLRILGTLALLLSSAFAYADADISEETSVGSSHFIQGLAGGGDFGATGDEPAPWDWNVGYTYEKSITPNTGGEDIKDITNDFTGTLGWTSPSGWGVDGFADFSSTPAENLTTSGGGITGSYKWNYGKGDLEFHPYLTTKLNLGSNTYRVSYELTSPFRKVQPKGPRVAGVSQLKQTFIGPEFVWRPWEQWKFTASGSFYHYDRDVNQFENQLDSPAALRLGMAGFSNTVGGLPRVTYSLGVHWYFDPSWDLGLNQDISTIATDGSSSGTSKATIEYIINNDWRAHLGFEVFTSTVVSDTLVIAGIEYDL